MAAAASDAPAIVVVGAGLAGAAVARALAERQQYVIVIDAASQVAGGASGNQAGIVKPFVTRDASPIDAFYRQMHTRLLQRLDQPGWRERCHFRQCGVLQLVNAPYPEQPGYEVVDRTAAAALAGQPLPGPALWFSASGWLNPARLCRSLLDHPLIDCRLNTSLQTLEPQSAGGWAVTLDGGRPRLYCRQLVLASGAALAATPYTRTLPLTPARGQISRFALRPTGSRLHCVVSGRHYALPADDTVYAGATFQRDDRQADLRPADHHSNLNGLRSLLPGLAVDETAIGGRAGIRATTPDRLPLLGPAPDIDAYQQVYATLRLGRSVPASAPAPVFPGLHLFGGLGSRGITVAVGAGELLADYICGRPEALQSWMPLLHPARFCIRRLRRAA